MKKSATLDGTGSLNRHTGNVVCALIRYSGIDMDWTHPAPQLLYPDPVKSYDFLSWTRATDYVRAKGDAFKKPLLETATQAILKSASESDVTEVCRRDDRLRDRLTLYGLVLKRDLRVFVGAPQADYAFELLPDVVHGQRHRTACPLEMALNGALVISADRYRSGSLERKFSGYPLFLSRQALRTALPVSEDALKRAIQSVIDNATAEEKKLTFDDFRATVVAQEPLASTRAITAHWQKAPRRLKHTGRPPVLSKP